MKRKKQFKLALKSFMTLLREGADDEVLEREWEDLTYLKNKAL